MLDSLLTTGLPPSSIAGVAITALVAGLARGFSGFGAALIFVPMASAIVGPRLAVPLLLVIDIAMTIGMVPGAFRKADRREVSVMAIGALVGVPLGTAVLTHLDPLVLRWGIVVLVFALLILLISGWRYRGRPKAPLTVLVGAVAGFCAGSTQIGGPPVVAYWLGGAAEATIVRANIVLYFEISSMISLTNFALSGLIVRDLIPLSLITAPLYGIGIYGGSRLFGAASDKTFRRISLGLIALAAVLGLPLFDSILR
jgi:uncharacterized membrane protein YfcA